MSSDLNDANARFLLGEAVRLLTQSGVTGVALAEFVLGFTPIVNERLASIAAATSTTAAGERVTRADVKDAVKEALQEVVSATGEGQEGRAKKRQRRKSVPVRLADGRRTSLWLDTDLVDRLKEKTSSPAEARQVLGELAGAVPDSTEKSKSSWVEEQLAKRLMLLEAMPTTAHAN
ncbi:hypothetical protein LMG22037_05850 [Paraburkholderia phenoliruptrix]|uniref:Uncharacterized protein n=1 Tax=Paraburkholderia phenoliruptrix TaxID=252970 RepID=A0A6J5CG36_9BURK|nr:hypothetical protein [Paraburkholderia phenoliruptrix]CAB3734098.1 hypothetical protein LMG22037_05850 [Paraburkholderia phenoliruptrix]